MPAKAKGDTAYSDQIYSQWHTHTPSGNGGAGNLSPGGIDMFGGNKQHPLAARKGISRRQVVKSVDKPRLFRLGPCDGSR